MQKPWAQMWRRHILKENWPSLSQHASGLKDSFTRLWACELSQLHARMLASLILYKQSQPLWVVSAASLSCPEDTVLLESSLTSGSYSLSTSSFLMFPETRELEVWYTFPICELALHNTLPSCMFILTTTHCLKIFSGVSVILLHFALCSWMAVLPYFEYIIPLSFDLHIFLYESNLCSYWRVLYVTGLFTSLFSDSFWILPVQLHVFLWTPISLTPISLLILEASGLCRLLLFINH